MHGDNLSTVKSTTAEWNCPTSAGGIFEKCRYLWQRIEIEGYPVTLRHLHGHKGHPGNEAADSVAKHFATTNAIYNGKRTKFAKMLAIHPELDRFWWHQETHALPSYGKPRFFDQGRMTSGKHEVQEESMENEEYDCVNLSLASVNVFSSLDKGSSMANRRKAIAKQADSLGWKVVALQETRYRMSIAKKDEMYYMFTASATRAGFFGCELWFAKRWQIAGRGLKERDFHILIEEPTMIAVAVNHPHLQADFLSVHAPQRQHDNQAVWWMNLHDFLKARQKKNRTVFILGDMNARVGNNFSDGIGRLFVQEECANGACLRAIIDDLGLALPSTFSEYHHGSSHTFQLHRLDYIAIPLNWLDCVQKSEVVSDFDMLHGKDDHLPIALNLCFARPRKSEKRVPTYDKKQASDPKNTKVIEKIFESFEEPDWETSVDDHCGALAQHVHDGLCEAFPNKEAKCEPRQPYIKGHLWDLVLERKKLRKDIKNGRKQQRLFLISKCWQAWRGNVQKFRETQDQIRLCTKYSALLEEMLEHSSRRIQKAVKKDKLEGLQETLENLEHAFKTKDNKQIFEALKPYQQQNAKRKLKTPKPLPFLFGNHGVVENQDEWHSAWEHHWANIEGACIKPWAEHQMNFIDNTVNLACREEEIMKAVPSLLKIEKAVRGIKRGKAGGIDGVCPDAVKLGGVHAARCIFTLATKELVRGQVPLIDRGGIALPLYKSKGPQSSRSSYRSIVLENCIGKTISRLWRPQIEQAFQGLAKSAQGGAKKGMGPTTHILRTRILQRRAFLCGDSYGLILLDMESAFYKAVRQLVVKSDDFEPTDEFAAHVAKNLGIGPEEYRVFYQHMMEATMLEQGEANRAIQRWVLSSMEGSWCKLRASQNCLATSLGTKPGDPTADVLYSLVMTKFLRVIHQQFQERPELAKCIHAMTWVDDVVLPVQECAEKIHETMGQILELMRNAATTLGMVPNLKRGKTEVILGFAGSGAQGSKRAFEKAEPVIHFNTLRGPKSVEAVNEATYLGAILEAKGRLMPEIVSCTSRAYSSVKPLKKAVLGNSRIPMHQRHAVVQALAFSKSTYTIGSWMPMRQTEEKAWRSRTMKTLRLLCNTRYGSDDHMTDEEVLVKTGSISPAEMITMATLRLCGMLAQWADEEYLEPFLDEHSMKKGTWMVFAVAEVNRLGKTLRTGWEQFSHFGDILKIFKGPRAQQHMNRLIKKYTKVLLHGREQRLLIHSSSFRTPSMKPENDNEEYKCSKCEKAFSSKAALGVHCFRLHGTFCEAYSFAATTTCFSCLGQYHSRERLVQHLQWGSMDCLEKIKAMVEPMTKEQILYLNGRDREQYRESKRQGKRHANQTRTYCREDISDIAEIAGDWEDFFAEDKMDEQERVELKTLEQWAVDGPLLELFEKLPNETTLRETLATIEMMGQNVQSAKVFLIWAAMIQHDLYVAYMEDPARSECMAAWAETRSRIVDRFL